MNDINSIDELICSYCTRTDVVCVCAIADLTSQTLFVIEGKDHVMALLPGYPKKQEAWDNRDRTVFWMLKNKYPEWKYICFGRNGACVGAEVSNEPPILGTSGRIFPKGKSVLETCK